jgi:3-oxoadipate enol-lactonase
VPIASVGDLAMAYEIHGSGDPVLMINGIGAAKEAWALQVPALAERHRVITFDNRDIGLTGPGANPARYGMEQFARDAAGLLDHLGIERAHVVGASMGGAIAQSFALQFPERTASLTVVCSWARTDPWLDELLDQWEETFRACGRLAWARTSRLWVFTWRAYRDPNFEPEQAAAAAREPNPQPVAWYLRQSHAARTFDVLDQLPAIVAPTHIICGEEDLLTPPRFSREIADAIPGSLLTTMPAVGHGMFWEATDAFNAEVLNFIDNHPLSDQEK